MSTSNAETGRCLCGAVSFSAEHVSDNLGACHCHMCQTWAGGPLMTLDCGTEVRFSGTDNIKVFNSSEWAERGFCNQCGSHLFYRLKANQMYIMPAGLFQAKDKLRFDHQLFIDEKPDSYSFAETTENLTGAEVFAKFASQAEADD